MKLISNIKIGTRLIIAFLIIAVLTGVIGTVGAINVSNTDSRHANLMSEYGDSQGILGNVESAFLSTRMALRDMILDKNPATNDASAAKIKDEANTITENLAKYEKLCNLPEEKQIFKELTADIDLYYSFRDKIMAAALAGKYDEAYTILRSKESTDASAATDKIISDTIAGNIANGDTTSAQIASSTQNTIVILIVLIAIGVIAAIALGLFVSSSISKPLRKMVEGANKLAVGDTNISMNIDSKDEVGILAKALGEVINAIQQAASHAEQIAAGNVNLTIVPKSDKDILSKSIKQMADTIRNLIAQMDTMSSQHDLGDIDVFIDAGQFQGSYQTMANGVNNMVKGHITVKKKAMACIAEFSRGNFEAPLEKFPGKKAFINENIELLRVNVKALIADADMLSLAAMQGRLDARADASKHQGDYRKIISGINDTLDAIIAPIQEAAQVLQLMAEKNLQVYVTGNYQGDHANIKEAINSTLDSLNEILSDINVAAEQVSGGTKQVSDGSQALSQGATEQASAIEQLTASVTEIATQTKQNAMNANKANDISTEARDSAVTGNDQMKEMLQSMAEINESSTNISKIIKVIDEIAFQTNLLALNAAVEAARAGQHGKGFAVVAEEVRNLAARSANAAKETTAMIEGSIKKVETGTRIANDTAQALVKIVDGVEKATQLVSGIAAASNEQATAVTQVNRGIEQVSQVVQTNSATAEESAAASEELTSQAEMLKEMVSRFRLKNQASAQPARITAKALPQGKLEARTGKPKISLNDREFGKY
jgi:methyl-accepting chemotaxis protein